MSGVRAELSLLFLFRWRLRAHKNFNCANIWRYNDFPVLKPGWGFCVIPLNLESLLLWQEFKAPFPLVQKNWPIFNSISCWITKQSWSGHVSDFDLTISGHHQARLARERDTTIPSRFVPSSVVKAKSCFRFWILWLFITCAPFFLLSVPIRLLLCFLS